MSPLALRTPRPGDDIEGRPGSLTVRASDREFLPAALEILETPPSPIRIYLLTAICAFVCCALAWSWIGRIDIIAAADGKVRPTGEIKVVQALETAKVAAILVRDGQEVRAGDVLVRLDSREAQADAGAASAALEAAKAERLRRLAALQALQALRAGSAAAKEIPWTESFPEAVRRREQRTLDADLRDLTSTVAGLKAQLAQKEAEQIGLRATIAAQDQLIATDRLRTNMKGALARTGAGSKADLVNANETLQYQEIMRAQEEGQLAQSTASERVVAEQVQEELAKFEADNSEKLGDIEKQADDLNQKLAKASAQLEHMTLKSPVDGTVQGLTVTTVGQVLTPGEEAMRIVPRGSELSIEAYLPDDQRGFVKVGDPAVVKIAAYPFTRYGTLPAHVIRVARDAVPQADATQRVNDPFRPNSDSISGGAEATQNLVYPLTLKLDRTTLKVDGVEAPLAYGMSVTAEIRTGDRRILDYLFSPLAETVSHAMKER